jgi:hypothetical protein
MTQENDDKTENNKEILPANSPSSKTSDLKDDGVSELMGDIQSMPPEIRQQVQSFMGMIQSQSHSPKNPLFEKFTEAHIDKYLDYVQRDDDNEYNLRKTNRLFYLAYFVISLIVFGAAIVYLLPKDKDFLESVIQIIIVLAGGIGAGYGLKSRKDE